MRENQLAVLRSRVSDSFRKKRVWRRRWRMRNSALPPSSHVRPLLIVGSNAIAVYMAYELLEAVIILAPQLCTVR
jgi:hypothetical protein